MITMIQRTNGNGMDIYLGLTMNWILQCRPADFKRCALVQLNFYQNTDVLFIRLVQYAEICQNLPSLLETHLSLLQLM